LTWLLNCVARVSELERMTQYKDRSASTKRTSAWVCLITGADGGGHSALSNDLVPVGEDQKQHLELTRDLRDSFQSRLWTKTFVVPDPFIPKVGARIMSLADPTKKCQSPTKKRSRLHHASG